MTGIPDFNYPAFDAAALALRAAGYRAVNPADHYGRRTDLSRQKYMKAALRAVRHADAVAVLPRWHMSAGAWLEAQTAFALDIPVYSLSCLTSPCAMDLEAAGHCTWSGINDHENGLWSARKPLCQRPWDKLLNDVTRCMPQWKGEHGPEAPAIDPVAYAAEKLKEPNTRAKTLGEAGRLVNGDRNAQYGAPYEDFSRTAAALDGLGYQVAVGDDVRALEPHDVAVILSAVKLSRIMSSPQKQDSWVDLAGYAACGAEVAEQEGE
jgi:hypothetical protein